MRRPASGSDTFADADDCVALGSGSQCGEREQTVAVGNRAITGVSYGTDNFDAANISQLRDVASGFGAGADYEGGSFQRPTYALSGGNTCNDVGSALTYLDGRIDGIQATPGQPGEAGQPGQAGNTGPKGDTGDQGHPVSRSAAGVMTGPSITTRADGSVDTTTATLRGSGGTTIRNLKAGVVSDDAANVGQVQQGLPTPKRMLTQATVKPSLPPTATQTPVIPGRWIGRIPTPMPASQP